jgi:hypothetical protein
MANQTSATPLKVSAYLRQRQRGQERNRTVRHLLQNFNFQLMGMLKKAARGVLLRQPACDAKIRVGKKSQGSTEEMGNSTQTTRATVQ